MVYKYSHAASHSACRAKLLTPLNLASWSPECHIGFLFNFKPAAILHQKAILDHKLWAKDQGNCPAIVQRAFLWRPFPGFIAITFFTATARIGRRVICRGHYGEFVDYVKTREVVVADRIWVRNIQGLRILFDVNWLIALTNPTRIERYFRLEKWYSVVRRGSRDRYALKNGTHSLRLSRAYSLIRLAYNFKHVSGDIIHIR